MTTDIMGGLCPNGCQIELDIEPQYTIGKNDARISHYEIYCDSCGYNAIIRRGELEDLNNAENEYHEYFAEEYEWSE